MSWIARSLVSSLGVDDDDDDDDVDKTSINKPPTNNNKESPNHEHENEEDTSRGGGVKEDLSELRKTLTRQLWGVASFLAPPPSSEHSQSSSSSSSNPPPPPPPPPQSSISDWNRWDTSASEEEVNESARIAGIRSNFAEIGGRFRTGISKVRDHRALSEISKIASTFLPFGIEEEDPKDLIGDAVGVTNEVLAFAANISMHPETWLDFPLADDEDSDDFDLSDAQQEHALAVERLAPRLAALRIELCPGYMSEGCFWKVYFVLLHSRLNKHDAELLSTPQIEEARAMLTRDIQSRTKSEPEWSAKGSSYSKEPPVYEEHHFSSSHPKENVIPTTESTRSMPSMDFETEKHPVVSTEMQIIDKSVVEEEPVTHSESKDLPVTASSKATHHSYKDEDDDGDDWLQDEGAEMGGFSGTTIPIGTEEDVSFSDLEDDDDESRPTSSKTVTNSSDSHSKKESQDWIQLSNNSAGAEHLGSKGSKESNYSKPENKDTSDWLDVDEIDIA